MKTEDVVKLNMALKAMREEMNPRTPLPVRFSYAMHINLRRTEGVLEDYRKIADPTTNETLAEFERRRMEIVQFMAEKDPDGNPIINNNEYVVLDRPALERAVLELQKEFPTLNDEVAALNDRVAALNDVDVDIDIHRVSFKDMPERISPMIMDGLFTMIKED